MSVQHHAPFQISIQEEEEQENGLKEEVLVMSQMEQFLELFSNLRSYIIM